MNKGTSRNVGIQGSVGMHLRAKNSLQHNELDHYRWPGVRSAIIVILWKALSSSVFKYCSKSVDLSFHDAVVKRCAEETNPGLTARRCGI